MLGRPPLSHGARARTFRGGRTFRERHGPIAQARVVPSPVSGSLGRSALVFQLPDRLRGTPHRPPPAAAVGCHEPEQEDDRLARDEQQHDHGDQQGAADDIGPLPDHRERGQDEQHGQHDQLEAETPEARAPLRVERLTLVLDRPGLAGRPGRRRVGGRVVVGHEPERYGRWPDRAGRAELVRLRRSSARSRGPRRPRLRAGQAGSTAAR